MTLSIELLPAPLGPMIARTSCSRTSKEMSVSAFTPPKDREMLCRSRSTSPIRFVRMGWSASGGLRCRFRREGSCVYDPESGRDGAGLAVLEAHLGLDEAVVAAVVQGVEQHTVLLGDEAPAHLARAGELAVVRIELLVQDEEAMDLRGRHHRVGG